MLDKVYVQSDKIMLRVRQIFMVRDYSFFLCVLLHFAQLDKCTSYILICERGFAVKRGKHVWWRCSTQSTFIWDFFMLCSAFFYDQTQLKGMKSIAAACEWNLICANIPFMHFFLTI